MKILQQIQTEIAYNYQYNYCDDRKTNVIVHNFPQTKNPFDKKLSKESLNYMTLSSIKTFSSLTQINCS